MSSAINCLIAMLVLSIPLVCALVLTYCLTHPPKSPPACLRDRLRLMQSTPVGQPLESVVAVLGEATGMHGLGNGTALYMWSDQTYYLSLLVERARPGADLTVTGVQAAIAR